MTCQITTLDFRGHTYYYSTIDTLFMEGAMMRVLLTFLVLLFSLNLASAQALEETATTKHPRFETTKNVNRLFDRLLRKKPKVTAQACEQICESADDYYCPLDDSCCPNGFPISCRGGTSCVKYPHDCDPGTPAQSCCPGPGDCRKGC
jgi:hypothetical protein